VSGRFVLYKQQENTLTTAYTRLTPYNTAWYVRYSKNNSHSQYIPHKFTKRTYSQYQQVFSDQTARNKTAPFIPYFINFKDFMYLYILMFYFVSFFNNLWIICRLM
jgi:hypothetical protein